MKLKTRLLMPLSAVLMLGMATSAFAQLNCTVSAIVNNAVPPATPGPVARSIVNGHWENTGDLQFVCTQPAAGVATTETSITVAYGATITNTPTLPSAAGRGHNISVVPTAGTNFAVALDTTRADTGGTGVSSSGVIALTLPAQPASVAGTTGTFVLQNVLLSLAGFGVAGVPYYANLNAISPSGNSTLTGSPVLIIGQVAPLLNSGTNPPVLVAPIAGEAVGPAQFTSAGLVPPATTSCSTASCRNAKASFSLVVTEDHVDSFRSALTYYNNGQGTTQNGTNVLFTFNGMLPGSSISNCVLVPSVGTWTLTGSGIANSAGTATLVAEAQIIPTPLNTLDTLTLNCGTSTANPGYLPGSSGTLTATTNIVATMSAFPASLAFGALQGIVPVPSETGGTPRYLPPTATANFVGPVTVVSFGGSAVGQTMMLIPYALANVGNFDTGISIANTTKDTNAFGTDAQGAAVDTAGGLTLYFYPGNGDASFSIVPPAGSFNLTTGGVLPSGNSFTGTLSDIMKKDGRTTAFQGYIIVVANFTHAHGAAYVYGGIPSERLTSSADVLVIANPLASGRNVYGSSAGFAEQTQK